MGQQLLRRFKGYGCSMIGACRVVAYAEDVVVILTAHWDVHIFCVTGSWNATIRLPTLCVECLTALVEGLYIQI